MKPNPILPLLAKIAPPLFFVTLVGFAIKEIFFASDKKPENESKSKSPAAQKPIFTPVKTDQKTPQNMIIPPDSAGKTNSCTVFPLNFVQNEPEILILPIPPENTQISANRRNFITREHMAAVFDQGRIQLTRKTAAEFLKKFGFGKSAAYEALSSNGRFSAWLKFTSDGMISWQS